MLVWFNFADTADGLTTLALPAIKKKLTIVVGWWFLGQDWKFGREQISSTSAQGSRAGESEALNRQHRASCITSAGRMAAHFRRTAAVITSRFRADP